MSVEYQRRRHQFIEQPEGTPYDFQVPDNEFFSYHFYHDLESVFWIFCWFLHHRAPAALDDTHIKACKAAVSISAHKWLYCGIEGSISRVEIFFNTNRELRTMYAPLQALYGQFSRLLIGMRIIFDITNAYKVIEATKTLERVVGNRRWIHWDEKHFTEGLYIKIKEVFDELLVMMAPHGPLADLQGIPVKDLVSN